MNEMIIIGLVLLAIGILMIAAGIILGFKESDKKKRTDIYSAPVEQSKVTNPENDVLHKMQHDEELKEKILKEIEKKST